MTQNPAPPELNMTLDGRFLPEPSAPRALPWLLRQSPRTLLAMVGAGAVLAAGLLLWLTVMLLPLLLVAGLAGWAALRLRAVLRRGTGRPLRRV